MWRRATSCNVLETIAGAKARALLSTEKRLQLAATSWAMPRIARLSQSLSSSQKRTQADSGINRGVPWLRPCPGLPWGLLQSSALGTAGVGDQQRLLLRSKQVPLHLAAAFRPLPASSTLGRAAPTGSVWQRPAEGDSRGKCLLNRSFRTRLLELMPVCATTPEPCAGETTSRSCSSKAVPVQHPCGPRACHVHLAGSSKRPRNLKLPRSKLSWNSTRSYQILSSSGISSKGTSPARCRGVQTH